MQLEYGHMLTWSNARLPLYAAITPVFFIRTTVEVFKNQFPIFYIVWCCLGLSVVWVGRLKYFINCEMPSGTSWGILTRFVNSI